MNLSIMQPYLFPYIGYFQLINASDTFVLYDDVKFINRGWIARNRILLGGKPHYLTVPLHSSSQNTNISEIHISNEYKPEKILKTIKYAYCKAQCFSEVYPLLESVFTNGYTKIGDLIHCSISVVCEYLGIDSTLLLSSDLKLCTELRAQDRIIQMCKSLEACTYINAYGGQQLYEKIAFDENEITLKFMRPIITSYHQSNAFEFIPNLSIIDIMMFNSKQEINKMLNNYELIDN